MSIFKFKHTRNTVGNEDPAVFFLNESNELVDETKSTKFIVKKYHKEGGFKEFFGRIRDPKFVIDSLEIPKPNLPFVQDVDNNPYTLYGLDKNKIIEIQGKSIPVYIPPEFISLTPKTFAGVERTNDEIAQSAEKRRDIIYNYYQTLEPRFVKSLTEVNCNSIAFLYSYLNGGEQWREGMEYYGYVDGLWETGSNITVSVDTNSWDLHTAVHELGHSVSYYLIDSLFEEWFNLAIDTSEKPPTQYAMTEVSEDFAESFSFHFGELSYKNKMNEVCPRRSEYMEKLHRFGSKAMVGYDKPSQELTQRFKKYDKVVYG